MRKTKPTDFSMALADYLFVFLPTQKGVSASDKMSENAEEKM